MATLYESVLGPSWSSVAPAVRRVHEPGASHGTFAVERGPGLFTALIALVFSLPAAGAAVPVHLRVTTDGDTQTWERTFGGRRLVSHQRAAAAGEIVERLAIVECRIAVSAASGALVMRSTGAALRVGPLRLAVPAWLAPAIEARAAEEGDAARVDVAIRSGWGGLLLRYHGVVRSA